MADHTELEQMLDDLQTIHRLLRIGMLSKEGSSITRVQWMMLRHIRKTGACAIGHLVDHFGVRPSTVSQMLDRLEKSGLIRRMSDARDARVKNVSLSEEGMRLIRDVEAVWLERLAVPFAQFTPKEQHQLTELLRRLKVCLSEQVARETPGNPDDEEGVPR